MANETIKVEELGLPAENVDENKGDKRVVSEEEALRRRAVAQANDDADGAHQGGFGAQGSAVDFGNPKNFGT